MQQSQNKKKIKKSEHKTKMRIKGSSITHLEYPSKTSSLSRRRLMYLLYKTLQWLETCRSSDPGDIEKSYCILSYEETNCNKVGKAFSYEGEAICHFLSVLSHQKFITLLYPCLGKDKEKFYEKKKKMLLRFFQS